MGVSWGSQSGVDYIIRGYILSPQDAFGDMGTEGEIVDQLISLTARTDGGLDWGKGTAFEMKGSSPKASLGP